MNDKVILLNHGSGGLLTRQLIDRVFVKRFSNPLLDALTDSSIMECEERLIAFTTDSFVVKPHFFPGGDIGKLAVCGTINDLAVAGATASAISAAFIIEEGYPIENLDLIAASMAAAAAEADVKIVTGDTKVVDHGSADGLFITTAGIGSVKPHLRGICTAEKVRPGDVVIVNGTIGDHGMAILAARNDLSFKSNVKSDCAPLGGLIGEIIDNYGDDVVFMRDATRGGLGTVLCELAFMIHRDIEIEEAYIPVSKPVRSMCEMFGFDPLFIANEGKVVMVVRPNAAASILDKMRRHRYGVDSAIIGFISYGSSAKVNLKTTIGGWRTITIPSGDQLPRIC